MKALITGASSGIGRDIARRLDSMGYTLILAARTKEKLDELNNSLGGRHRVIKTDLSNHSEAKRLYEEVKREDIDILINNAGFGLFGSFDETDLETELNMLSLNIEAVHILTKLFLRDFKKRNRGTILNVASSAAFLPGPLMATYYATKAYVLRLSAAIREELRRDKSKVVICTLCPGPVKTDFDERAGVSFSLKGLASEYVADYAVKSMLKGRSVIIPGFTMKIGVFFSKILPDFISVRIAYNIQHSKNKH